MHRLSDQIQFKINEKVYLKDPNSSALGKRIVEKSILLIEEIGLEAFTFKKLAKCLDTTESSIYRYFENKYKLLIYLISWYWDWLEYQITLSTHNLPSAEMKLEKALEVVTSEINPDENVGNINLATLHRMVISESPKAYLTKAVDQSNKEGLYSGIKRVVNTLSDLALEFNSSYKYPHTLMSTILEGINHQKYFAAHLPSLTDIQSTGNDLTEFYYNLAISTLHPERK